MPTHSEILPALLAAITAPDPWPHFLSVLAGATRAKTARLCLFRAGRAERCWQAGRNGDAPPVGIVARMRSGRVYSQADLPGGAAPSLRALRVMAGPDTAALLALHRDGTDFRAADGVALSNLVPYLPLALTNWLQLEEERARAALDRDLTGDLGAGWIMLSPTGQVLDMAPGLAERLAAVGIGPHDGRLSLPGDGAASNLRRRLASTAEGPQTVALSPGLNMLISAQDFAGRPALIARLRLAPSARNLPAARLARWFGLSRSQARLAMLIGDGFTLQEAAGELGWTLETVRSCSKQIYARTGARGQPDLVRRIWASGVWLEAGR